MLVQGGDENMVLSHARALRYLLTDLYVVMQLDADVVDSHKDQGLLPVTNRHGVEIQRVAHALGGAAMKISRKVRPQGRGDVKSCKSGF